MTKIISLREFIINRITKEAPRVYEIFLDVFFVLFFLIIFHFSSHSLNAVAVENLEILRILKHKTYLFS